jgi:hypothetical protein
MKAQAGRVRRGGWVEVWFYPFINLGVIWGWLVNVKLRPIYSREREPVRISQEAVLASVPVWAGTENLSSFGV